MQAIAMRENQSSRARLVAHERLVANPIALPSAVGDQSHRPRPGTALRSKRTATRRENRLRVQFSIP
jgi:hypothetical protein